MEDKTKDLGDVEVYELGYHILPTILEEDLQSELSKIHNLLSSKGASIISEGSPQMKQLAYEMIKKVDTKNNKFNKAFFGWVKFELERSKVLEVKKGVDEMPNILRFIIIKTVKENTFSTPKITSSYKRSEEIEREPTKGAEEKVEIDEKEIDKSIDELVVEDAV